MILIRKLSSDSPNCCGWLSTTIFWRRCRTTSSSPCPNSSGCQLFNRKILKKTRFIIISFFLFLTEFARICFWISFDRQLDSNHFMFLPEGTLEPLKNLQYVNLIKNPWHCDCSILYLTRYRSIWLRLSRGLENEKRGFFILNCSWSIPDGSTNTLIWYGIINPSAAVPASSAVNLFTPWRLTTSATDSGRLWCNFYSQKLEWRSFTVSRANVFHFMAGLSKIGFEPESVKRGSYKPALRRITLAFSIPTYPHNLFHSLIQVNSTYQCMSTTFHTKFNHFLWWV